MLVGRGCPLNQRRSLQKAEDRQDICGGFRVQGLGFALGPSLQESRHEKSEQ